MKPDPDRDNPAEKDQFQMEKFSTIDSAWKGIVKWGGFSLFLAAVILILFIVGQGVLKVHLPMIAQDVLDNPIAPVSLFIMTIFGEFLLFPGMLALYFTLRNDDQSKMFLATALGIFSVLMFLVSRAHIISLSSLSASYQVADLAGKTAYLATAEAVLEIQNVFATMALIFLSLASILIGFVMLKGSVFSKPVGYITLLSGCFTIFTPFAVNLGIPLAVAFIGLVLTLIWQFWAGLKMFRLGGHL